MAGGPVRTVIETLTASAFAPSSSAASRRAALRTSASSRQLLPRPRQRLKRRGFPPHSLFSSTERLIHQQSTLRSVAMDLAAHNKGVLAWPEKPSSPWSET